VNRAERKARIFEHGKLKHTYPVIVGRPSLPTPAGSFFVTEIMEDKGEVTGPYALATSDFSNVLQEFDGGPGQIALHGREGLPEPISTASSHGCIRFEAAAITWMAWHLEAGVPVIVR
jgi:lipoprotein-anchoring transpeptidase ErfK/SrfK